MFDYLAYFVPAEKSQDIGWSKTAEYIVQLDWFKIELWAVAVRKKSRPLSIAIDIRTHPLFCHEPWVSYFDPDAYFSNGMTIEIVHQILNHLTRINNLKAFT